MSTPLPPDAIMRQIAAAIPEQIRTDIIIVGSLAAGSYFFGSAGTKKSPSLRGACCVAFPAARQR